MSDFVKAKLSHRAVDAFMLKYEDKIGLQYTMEYTTCTGQKIKVSVAHALTGIDEYLYLMRQLSAVHNGLREFPINQVAVIRKKDGKDALWTKDTQLIKDFVQMGKYLGFLDIRRGSEGGIIVRLSFIIDYTPILHGGTE